jgi:hypothetical protein
MTTRWTIERYVNSAPTSTPRLETTTTAARKTMIAEMAHLGLTVAPSLRALASEESAFYFVRHPADPDHTYVRIVAARV